MNSQSFDAIIVGSGLGGLSCAAYLAKHGQKVLVIEKHSVPGGYASGFRRGPYTFDAGLHMICGVGKGQNMAKFYQECGISDSVDFLKIKHLIRAIYPQHDLRFPSGDLEGVIEAFEQKFPDQKEGIRAFFKQATKLYEDVFKVLFSSTPVRQQIPIFPFRYRTLFSLMKKTVKELLDKHIKNEQLKTLMFANYGFYGLPPSQLSMYGLFGNMDFWVEGAYYPKGGNQTIPDAFVEVIQDNNGQLLLKTEVSSIITQDNRAVGVITQNGSKFYGKSIISNACPMSTFRNLVGDDKLPPKFLSRLEGMVPSISTLGIFLGLDEGFKATLKNTEDYEILVSETYNQDEDFKWILDGNVEKSSFFINMSSNMDGSLAKGNRFVLSLWQKQPYSVWQKYEEAYSGGKKEEYNKEKDRRAGVLIKRAEKVVPDLSKHIEVIEIVTPLTFKRYTGNYNCAIMGWENNVRQFTPMDRLDKIPIKNLYLSSAWSFPGEGQAPTVVCGCKLAKQIMAKQ